jgi:hypothetical protein
MPSTTQIVIKAENKLGTLAQVASVLARAGVNIKAFSAPDVQGESALRILVADLDRSRIALQEAKIRFTEETALILSLENKPGALSQVADLLRQARINITCGYCTPSREGRRAIVVLTVSDPDKALEALRGQSLDEF